MLKRLLILFALLLSTHGLCAASGPVPSGPVKAFKGPEGETIVMMEVNSSKEILVHYKGIGGDLEGKSFLYFFEEQRNGKKDVYMNVKEGRKTSAYYVLSFRNSQWEFFNPNKKGNSIKINYSEKDSEKFKSDELLAAYKP